MINVIDVLKKFTTEELLNAIPYQNQDHKIILEMNSLKEWIMCDWDYRFNLVMNGLKFDKHTFTSHKKADYENDDFIYIDNSWQVYSFNTEDLPVIVSEDLLPNLKSRKVKSFLVNLPIGRLATLSENELAKFNCLLKQEDRHAVYLLYKKEKSKSMNKKRRI